MIMMKMFLFIAFVAFATAYPRGYEREFVALPDSQNGYDEQSTTLEYDEESTTLEYDEPTTSTEHKDTITEDPGDHTHRISRHESASIHYLESHVADKSRPDYKFEITPSTDEEIIFN